MTAEPEDLGRRAALILDIAQQTQMFIRHVPNGAELLTSDPRIALSSDGRLMIEAGDVRYFVAVDGVARVTPRADGRFDFHVLQEGRVTRRAVAADIEPPSNPEVN